MTVLISSLRKYLRDSVFNAQSTAISTGKWTNCYDFLALVLCFFPFHSKFLRAEYILLNTKEKVSYKPGILSDSGGGDA